MFVANRGIIIGRWLPGTLQEGNNMKLWWWMNLAVAGLAGVWLSGLALAAQGQAVAPAAGKKAGEAFKNVTTSTLKELSVDDFVASMGLISAESGS